MLKVQPTNVTKRPNLLMTAGIGLTERDEKKELLYGLMGALRTNLVSLAQHGADSFAFGLMGKPKSFFADPCACFCHFSVTALSICCERCLSLASYDAVHLLTSPVAD